MSTRFACIFRTRNQNSKYEPVRTVGAIPPVPVDGNKPSSMPCRLSHAASVKAGSAPTMSRIICHAARFSAPSGAGPMASDTEHCGQKLIRCAADFCRGLTPTVCANRYTATDFCPASSSRLQRRQNKFSKTRPRMNLWKGSISILSPRMRLRRKYADGFRQTTRINPRQNQVLL